MLKKLLTGCLTIAMIGAFSASAAADTTCTWTGNVEAHLLQTTTKDATDGAKSVSEMDMKSTGDLDLAVVKSGDTWTGTAYFDLDWDASAVTVDDLYVKMSKDTLAISFGEFDPVGIGKGDDYLGEVDETYGAGEAGYYTPNEQGWVVVSLTDVGLDLMLGINEESYDASDDDYTLGAITANSVNNGDYSSTAFGAKFDKTFGDLGLAVSYVSKSTKRDENNGDHVTESTMFDGASASTLGLAVQYTMGEMAFTLNYTGATFKSGVDGAEELKQTYTEILFDMAVSETQGLTVAYGMRNDKSGDTQVDQTDIHLGFMMSMGGVDNYFNYYSMTNKDKDADNSASESRIGYTMKVEF